MFKLWDTFGRTIVLLNKKALGFKLASVSLRVGEVLQQIDKDDWLPNF
jgi:hypothetical protein